MQCPICKKKVEFDSAEMPFCSKRCRIIDLGDWASEKVVISTSTQRTELEDEFGSSDLHELDPNSGLLQ